MKSIEIHEGKNGYFVQVKLSNKMGVNCLGGCAIAGDIPEMKRTVVELLNAEYPDPKGPYDLACGKVGKALK